MVRIGGVIPRNMTEACSESDHSAREASFMWPNFSSSAGRTCNVRPQPPSTDVQRVIPSAERTHRPDPSLAACNEQETNEAREAGVRALAPAFRRGNRNRAQFVQPAERATETVLEMPNSVARSAGWTLWLLHDTNPRLKAGATALSPASPAFSPTFLTTHRPTETGVKMK